MAFFLQNAWLIPVLPFVSCALILLTPIRRNKQVSGGIAIGLMGVAALFALGLLVAVAQGLHLQADGSVVVVSADVGPEAAAEELFAFPEPNLIQRFVWAPTGTTNLTMGLYVDPLVATMLAMVTITSTCIHLFSLGYMATNARQTRFFAFISLFTAAMLLMTMASNLLLFFMAWELMGLCSYLLIGFLFERPQANRAAINAFIVTRIGDVLMLIGIVYLYTQAGSLDFGMAEGQLFNPALLERLAITPNLLGMSHATTIALLLFCGTIGKAAQFPLHVWLPDAMEGPTPVSALIHAATMVSAGVFLVGHTYPIFLADGGTALRVVAMIGTFTALFAAAIAVAQFDMKRILAYSTISQLGFMIAVLGIGGWVAGMFHLLTHAFFKALLFLGSGSIIHAMELTPPIEKIHHSDAYSAQQTAQDIRNMGGLKRRLPWTFWTYTVGYLALLGIPPLAGFWSKDEILAVAFARNPVVFVLLAITSFLTTFYMTRQWRTVFFGNYRGDTPRRFVNPEARVTPPTQDSDAGQDAHSDDGTHTDHAVPNQALNRGGRWHEDPTMIVSLVVLAFFAAIAGLFNEPFSITLPGGGVLFSGHWLTSLWEQELETFNWIVAGGALLIASLGIWLGWNYDRAFQTAQDQDPLEARYPELFQALASRLYIDQVYAATIGRITAELAHAWAWLDQQVLDRLVNGTGMFTFFLGRINFVIDDTLFNDGPDALAKGTMTTGKYTRRLQTGKAQDYLDLVVIGVVVLGAVYLYLIRG